MTYARAAIEIRKMFEAAWTRLGHPVVWPNEDSAGVPPATQTPWARGTMLHAAGGEASLAGNIGHARYTRGGVAMFQIFTPLGSGVTPAYHLAQRITNVFDGAHSPRGVYFRNTRIREVGSDGAWFQINVITEFEYEEVK